MAEPSVDYTPAGGFVLSTTDDMWTYPQDDQILDRRSKKRTVVNRDALMFFTGSEVVHSCLVLNATNDGAGIRLNGLSVMPSDFGISFDRFRTMRKCRMVWRDGNFTGAVFES